MVSIYLPNGHYLKTSGRQTIAWAKQEDPSTWLPDDSPHHHPGGRDADEKANEESPEAAAER